MRTNRLLSISSWLLIGITVMGILSVSFMAFGDPQAVMDLVHVKLDNTDAYSSIRGVYGGVGIAILGVLLYKEAISGWSLEASRRDLVPSQGAKPAHSWTLCKG